MKKTIIFTLWGNGNYRKIKVIIDLLKKDKNIMLITLMNKESIERTEKNNKYKIKKSKHFCIIKREYTIIAFFNIYRLVTYLRKNLSNINNIFFLYNHKLIDMRLMKLYILIKLFKIPAIYIPRSIYCIEKIKEYSDENDFKKLVKKSLKRKLEIDAKIYALYLSLLPFLIFKKIFYSKKKEKSILKNPKKILFIRVDRFGDMVLSFSSIVALRKRFPETEIYVLCSPMNADFLIEQNKIDKRLRIKIVVWKNIWDMHGDFLPGTKEFIILIKQVLFLRKLRFDIIIQPIPKSVWTILSLFLKSRILVSIVNRKFLLFRLLEPFIPISSIIDKDEYIHSYYQASNCLKPLGTNYVDISNPKYDLKTLNEKIKKINLKKSIIINVSAGDRVRILPSKKLEELIREIIDTYNFNILLIGVKQDLSLCEKLSNISDKIVNLCGQTKINDLIYLFNKAKLLITPDTGTMHLASLCNIYIIAYFGAGTLRHFAPITENSYVIKHELGCSGCRDVCFKKEYPKPCIDVIQTEEILRGIKKIIDEDFFNVCRHKKI